MPIHSIFALLSSPSRFVLSPFLDISPLKDKTEKLPSVELIITNEDFIVMFFEVLFERSFEYISSLLDK